MEAIILGGIAVVVTLFIVVTQTFFPQPPWGHEAQDMARSMWLAIVVASVAVSVVWFGVAALLSIWPFWLMLAVASSMFFAFGEWRARRNERKTAPRQTLVERRDELVQQGKPTDWIDRILG